MKKPNVSQQSFFLGKMKGNVGAGLDRAKALGIVVLGFSLFYLYLAVAKWFWDLKITTLPFEAAVNNFVTPIVFIDVAIVNLYLVCRQRRVSETRQEKGGVRNAV